MSDSTIAAPLPTAALIPLIDAAKRLNLNPATLRHWRACGREFIPSFDLAGRIYYRAEDIILFDTIRQGCPQNMRIVAHQRGNSIILDYQPKHTQELNLQ